MKPDTQPVKTPARAPQSADVNSPTMPVGGKMPMPGKGGLPPAMTPPKK